VNQPRNQALIKFAYKVSYKVSDSTIEVDEVQSKQVNNILLERCNDEGYLPIFIDFGKSRRIDRVINRKILFGSLCLAPEVRSGYQDITATSSVTSPTNTFDNILNDTQSV